jgi:hypothetical protein
MKTSQHSVHPVLTPLDGAEPAGRLGLGAFLEVVSVL